MPKRRPGKNRRTPSKRSAHSRRVRLATGHVSADVFARLVDSVTDYAIFVIDPEGRIATWNPGAKRIKGYSEKEALGQHIRMFYPPEEQKAKRPEKLLAKALTEGHVEDEAWRVKKDGTRFWARVVISRIDDADGTLLGFAKVTQDLTSRREEERRFRLLIDGVRDYAIFPLDPEGRISGWNEGAQRIKGWKPKEVIGKHFSIFYTREDKATHKPERELEIARRVGRVEDEGWRLKKDGARFWANVVITAIFEGKTLIGYSKITRDLTERRKLEQVEATARVKDEFLATVSHELRTPIHAVVGWLKILRSEKNDRASRERALDAVERNAQAQSRIIEDLLDVSRVTSGRLRVKFEPVDMLPVVEAALDAVRPTAKAKGVDLLIDHAPELPLVSGDRERLVQVVWNLLTNAVKFTPEGGRVTVTSRRVNGSVEVEVVDTGRGIPRDFLPSVFDRFRQADATATRTVGGLGVGLTVARHLVELHGGTISAESQGDGKGATFRVQLPASRR